MSWLYVVWPASTPVSNIIAIRRTLRGWKREMRIICFYRNLRNFNENKSQRTMEMRPKTKKNNETIRNYSLLSQRETMKLNFFVLFFILWNDFFLLACAALSYSRFYICNDSRSKFNLINKRSHIVFIIKTFTLRALCRFSWCFVVVVRWQGDNFV